MFITVPRLFAWFMLSVAVLGIVRPMSAQERAHHASGVAQFAANQSDFTGSGHATHLGLYTEVGNVSFAPTGTPGVFAVSGWSHYISASGDELHADITGAVDMTTGAIFGTATYVGGTGRFATASGSSQLVGQMLGGGALTITAHGSILY